MTEFGYEEKFVLLLDILGFRKYVESDTTEEFAKKITAILETIEFVTKQPSTFGEVEITQFSDTFVVSSNKSVAINRAYEMEAKEAIYPRIIIDDIAFERVDYTSKTSYITQKRDFDGFYCTEYNLTQQTVKPHKESIQTFIKENLIKSYNKISIRQKYYYLAKKFFTEDEVEKLIEEAKNAKI